MAVTGTTLLVGDRVRQADEVEGDAVRIRAGKIEAVGWADDLRHPGLAEDRYPGCTIVPGLGDAHFHPAGYTAALTRLNVSEARSFDDVIQLVRTAAAETPAEMPVIGTRLDDEHLTERALPDRHQLDRATTTQPVLLYRYCGHIAVANSRALAAAGITSATADPVGGRIDRDEAGEPTGVLRETAIELVADKVGNRSKGQTPDELNRALRGLVQQGLTRLGAIVSVGEGVFCGVGDELDLICNAAPELPLDLSVFVIAATPGDLEAAAIRLNSAGRRVSFAGLKVFADGSLGGQTAAMDDPYTDGPDSVGTLRFEVNAVDPIARAAIELGGGVAIHAIGDRANRTVLDFMTTIRADHPDALLRVEHASVLDFADIARFAELDVIASVQPAFMASETDWLERRLGQERMRRTYPFRALTDAGARLAGGSDCPVEPPDPIMGMAAARDRCGITPDQALTGAEALAMFTDGVTASLGIPNPLEPGARAHLTILDQDPLEVSPVQLRQTRVVSTWIDGESVPTAPNALIWS